MKTRTILTLSILFATICANAQIKVHSDNHISIGSLNKDFGVQINPSGYTYFASRLNNDYTWVTLANANNNTTKCWIVNRNDMNKPHRFYVNGFGTVYRYGEATLSDSSLQNWNGNIEHANDVINQINGFYYTYSDNNKNSTEMLNERRVGLSAQELENVIPEAVLKDEEGVMYLDYEVLTVFLIEAVKEQHKEIIELYKILENNGLIK